MKRYLIYSQFGEGIFLARVLKRFEHEVGMYISNEKYSAIGRGFEYDYIEHFWRDLKDSVSKYGKENVGIIFDASGVGDLADHLMDDGHPVMGGTLLCDDLEYHRNLATEIFGEIMKTPPTWEFKNFNEARTFLKSQPKDTRFIFKPDGTNAPKSWTYMADDIADMLYRLSYFEENWDKADEVSFQIQLKINGLECDYGEWTNGKKLLKNSGEWYFEDKKAYSDSLGPTVGCASALEYFIDTDKEYYHNEYFSKIEQFLSSNRYSGNFSINNIYSTEENELYGVEADTFYMIETNPRFGYDALQNQLLLLIMTGRDPALLLDACLTRSDIPEDYFPIGSYAFNVRFFIPPYPAKEEGDSAKGADVSIPKKLEKNFMPFDLLIDDGQYKCAMGTGCLGTIGDVGKDPEKLVEDVHELAKQIDTAEVAWRSDGGKSGLSRMRELQQRGAISSS